MQSLILSDIHANWYALEAVLADAQGEYEEIICCGDLVGYNPHPAKVIEWTRQNCKFAVRGNHDKVVCGLEDLSWFNENAQAAALWTRRQLVQSDIYYLAELPQGPRLMNGFEIVHGSPLDEDEYISEAREAAPCFPKLETPLAFFGHTHLQGGYFCKRGKVASLGAVKKTEREAVLELDVDTQYMVNPGSVGQPRDGDVRAAYALYDPERMLVTLRRVVYPIKRTAADIEKAGLPDVLGVRLFHAF